MAIKTWTKKKNINEKEREREKFYDLVFEIVKPKVKRPKCLLEAATIKP